MSKLEIAMEGSLLHSNVVGEGQGTARWPGLAGPVGEPGVSFRNLVFLRRDRGH